MVPDLSSMQFHSGSLKKRVAPAPPAGTAESILLSSPHSGGTTTQLPPPSSHSRTTSEPILTSHTSTNQIVQPVRALRCSFHYQNHKRSPIITSPVQDEFRKFLFIFFFFFDWSEFVFYGERKIFFTSHDCLSTIDYTHMDDCD